MIDSRDGRIPLKPFAVLDWNELCFSGDEGYLEDLWPKLAGDEEAIMRWVVGDAVENCFIVGELAARQQAFEVDPAEDAAGGG